MKNIPVIGIDIGYGFTKVYGSGNLSRVFPSHVSTTKARGAFGAPENVVIVSGKSYVVGDNIGTFGDYSVGNNFLGTPEYLALLGEALASTKIPYQVLVLGLPPGLYDEDRIEKLTKTISEAVISTPSGIIQIPKMIKFVPQGAGIYFDYINSLQAGGTPPGGTTVIIDIGHYTLDLVLFSNLKYVHGMARSYPLGISKLYDEVKTQFAKVHGQFINNDDKVLRLIRDGQYTHFNKTYSMDTKPIVNDYIQQKVYKAIRNYDAELRESSQMSVEHVIIGGGGVQCIGKNVGHATLIEDPQMSNARGYYHFGRRQAVQLEKEEQSSQIHVVAGS